jgi:hypothetical protein
MKILNNGADAPQKTVANQIDDAANNNEAVNRLHEVFDVDDMSDFAETKGSSKAPDPFDLASLRIDDDDEQIAQEQIVEVPVGRPSKDNFFRVHPSHDFRLPKVAVMKIGDGVNRETYLLYPHVRTCLSPTEYSLCTLYTYIDEQGDIGLWPVTLPGSTGKVNAWHSSALKAAELAQSQWVRIAAHKKHYKVHMCAYFLPVPDWGEVCFDKLVEVAFKGRIIKDPNHEIIKKYNTPTL